MYLRWISCGLAVKLFSFLFYFMFSIYLIRIKSAKRARRSSPGFDEIVASNQGRCCVFCPVAALPGREMFAAHQTISFWISRSKRGNAARFKAYLTALHLADVAINHQVGPASATGCLTNVPQSLRPPPHPSSKREGGRVKEKGGKKSLEFLPDCL